MMARFLSLLASLLFVGFVDGTCKARYTHNVYIKTGIKRGAESAADVYIQIGDGNGKWSEESQLETALHSFQHNTTDLFHVNAPSIGKAKEIRIRRGLEGANDTWFLELVTVKELQSREDSIFPVTRWFQTNSQIYLVEYDYTLPSQEKYSEQRRVELEKQREMYQLTGLGPGLPLVVKEFPEEEARYNLQYETLKVESDQELKLKLRNPEVFNGEIKELEDLEDMFIIGNIPKPKRIDIWMNDTEFARQRLTGINPREIKLCTSIPQRFSVTSDMVEPFLEGRRFEDALLDKRIFIVDHSALESLQNTTYLVPSPYALFYVRDDGILIPIAIQLMAEPALDNPVFLPSDPFYTWLMAKMWFNYADASVQASATHLGFTHLIIGPTSVITRRQLSPSHPIYKLLMPHFHMTLAVENISRRRLLGAGGLVEILMGMGQPGLFQVIARERSEWSLQDHGNIPNDFENRGVESPDVLPNYFYRDDAMLFWEAIQQYVTDTVNVIYANDAELVSDAEIQAFAAELGSSTGLNLKGIPDRFDCKEDLIEFATFIIYTATVEHTAVNDAQYDEYAFFPHYPLTLVTDRPKSKAELTEEDIVKALPSKEVILKTLVLMNNMSITFGNPMGYFETPFAYHPSALRALEKFRDQLKKMSRKIIERNEKVAPFLRYTDLLPSNVQNSITE